MSDLYSTNDIVALLNVPRQSIHSAKLILGIVSKTVYEKKVKKSYYTKQDLIYFTEYFTIQDPMKRRAYAKEVQKQQDEAELKGHPLVTDRRLLNINFWPDIVPKYFEDMEA